MGEVIIVKIRDDFSDTTLLDSASSATTTSSSWFICRICHEGDSLQSPCACSGSLKFAHRECVQRWCNEKGNTICEICLQKFEPGYTALPKKAMILTSTAALRGRGEYERIENTETERESPHCYSPGCLAAVDRSVSCCKFVAFLLTVVLLLRHLLPLIEERTTPRYPFALPTLVVLRASGIIFPMYILLRIINAFHNTVRHLRDLEAQLSTAIAEDQRLPIV